MRKKVFISLRVNLQMTKTAMSVTMHLHTNLQSKVLLLVITLLQTFFCFSQEIHFSQFYANPLTINPAQTAWYDGNVRFHCMYRTQWKAIDSKPFQTISFSAEKQFHLYDHTYGFGILALRDESGYVGLIQNKLLLSGAFAAHVNGHELSGGIQLGLIYKTTNTSKYTYDSQYELGGEQVFNPNLYSGEIEGKQFFHPAINAGIEWKKQLTRIYTAEVGMSIFNINTPNESFYGTEIEDSEQPLRFAFQIAGEIQVNQNWKIKPNILFMRQEKATDFLIGTNAQYQIQKDFSVYGGTLFRYGFSKNYDASVWIVGTRIKRFDIGLSYDINVSALRTATNCRGALEVSLTYLSPSWQSSKIAIPCERL